MARDPMPCGPAATLTENLVRLIENQGTLTQVPPAQGKGGALRCAN
jgi:hypothetical protein